MATTSSRQLKNICVLFGFHYGKYEDTMAAIDLGLIITERKLHQVYRGGDRVLLKLISEVALLEEAKC